MLIDIHAQARTTPAMREAIQQADGSVAELARRFGVSEQTIRKWRSREDVADRSHRPARLGTTLDALQEDLLVALRIGLRLPLDELLALARAQLQPPLSRSALDRTLRRRNANRLDLLRPAVPGDLPVTLLSLAPLRRDQHAATRLLLLRRWPDLRLALAVIDAGQLAAVLQPWIGEWAVTGSGLLLAGDDCELPLTGADPNGQRSTLQAVRHALLAQHDRLSQELPGRLQREPGDPQLSPDPLSPEAIERLRQACLATLGGRR